MQRLAVFGILFLLIPFLLVLGGCGGGSSSTTGNLSQVVMTPTTASLDMGGVVSISASPEDASNNVVTTSLKTTFSSSNTAVATVSTAGLVCAGAWDANFIVCTPGQPGTATITATIGSFSGTATIYSHPHVDTVSLDPLPSSCSSMGTTQTITAHAFHNTGSGSPPQDITSLVGPFTFSTGSSTVATVNTAVQAAGNVGVVKGAAPGVTNVHAGVAGVSSTPAPFTVCLVQSIHLHLSGAPDTTFSLAPAGTQSLTADIVDTSGAGIAPPLTWNTSRPTAATIATTGIATAVAAGTSSITASCSPPSCNQGLTSSQAVPIYSNVVLGNVTGASATTTAYATGTTTTSLIPIDTSANTAGTAITLGAQPNSFLLNPAGTQGYLGSNSGLMVLTVSSNSVAAPNPTFPGKVLAVSPDGNRVIIAATNQVFVFGAASSTSSDSLPIFNATAAAFTPDGQRAFIVAGASLYVYGAGTSGTSGSILETLPLPTSMTTAAVLASGAFGLAAGGSSHNVIVSATCNGSLSDTVATPTASAGPTLLRSLPDASAVLAVDSPGIDVITPATNNAGCPPAITDAIASKDFGQGPFTPNQLILPSSGAKAFVTSNLPVLLVYTVSTSGVSTIPLANGAHAFTGGVLGDGSMLYVGGSDNAVHRIDPNAGTDTPISLSFTPDLVAVIPK